MRTLALVSLGLVLLAGCERAAAIGATCSRPSDCTTGTCEFGRCRAACHANRDCPSGASCLLDASGSGACGLDVDLGCESGVGRECPAGLVCVADRCERACAGAGECPMDGDCRAATSGGAMFCFDARTTTDAGASDAPETDGGTQTCAVTSMCFGRMGSACALDCLGRVWCWGQQHGGRLGNGHGEDLTVTTPGQVIDEAGAPMVDVDTLACGDGFSCVHVGPGASIHARHVLCWGYDEAASFDASAHNAATDLFAPIVADSMQLSGAGAHMCALDHATTSVVCFGRNDALIDPSGANTTPFSAPTPPAGGLTGVAEIGVAAFGACARMQGSGEVRCWGENDLGQAGHFPIDQDPSAAEPNVGITVVEASAGIALAGTERLAVGYTQRAVLAHTGASGPLTLSTWGGNQNAQLGETTGWVGDACDNVLGIGAVCRARPATPVASPVFTTIASEGSSWATCGVLASSHHVICWGDNLYAHGGVPDGGSNWIAENKEVLLDGTSMPLSDVVDVFQGAANGCAIRGDGSLWCWGPNRDGQLARPSDTMEHFALPIVIPFP